MEKETKTTPSNAKVWKDRFEYQQNKLRKVFEDTRKYYDVLYAVQKVKGISPWKSKVYVPVLASKAWDLIARVSDVTPLFNVKIKEGLMLDDNGNFAKRPDIVEAEQRIQAKLHEDYNCSEGEPMKFKIFDALVDAVAAGTGYAYAKWEKDDKVSKTRKVEGEKVVSGKTMKKTTHGGKNDFESLNFFNVFPSNDAGSNWQGQSYIIVQGYIPKYKAKARGWKNVELASTKIARNQEYQLNNEARNRVVNEQDSAYVDDSVDMVTYYECFARDETGVSCSIFMEGSDKEGNTTWVTAKPKHYPYMHDMYPVVPFYTRRKSFSVFGESLFENNRTLQSAVNDLFNHYLDNWNLSIESMIMYEDGTLTNNFRIQPGGEITFTGEPPKQFKFPEPNPTQLSVVMQVLEKGIENATFSQYATGVPNSATDKTQGTAYGIKSITEAASTKIGFFRDNFKQSMKTVGKIWLSNLKQFEDNPQEVTRQINGRDMPDIVMPTDYQYDTLVDIDDDSMVPLSKQEKLERHERFINSVIAQQNAAYAQYQVFKQAVDIPRVNWVEIFDDSARLSSVKDSSRYLLDNAVEIPQPVPDKPTPEELALEGITKKYDKTDPDIKSQLEEIAGLQPSAMHDTEIVTDAMEHGRRQAEATNPGIGVMDGTTNTNTSGSPTEGNS